MGASVAIPAALDRFRQVWALDFEFLAAPGHRPDPVCMVARELRTGRELRMWGAELRRGCPIQFDAEAVLIAYFAPAELTCFLALGWPMPANVLDLFAEWRTFTNGRTHAMGTGGNGLLSALSHFGLSHLDPEEKSGWRDRILLGRPYSPAERAGILGYCASDADALAGLLAGLAGRLEARPRWIDHALLRGRYMRAAAAMEHRGVPIDAELLSRITARWDEIKLALVDGIRADFPIFDGSSLRLSLFDQWLMSHGIPWPRTETGRLATDDDTFKAMTRAYPILAPVRELHSNLGKLRLTDLAVGPDGRNRTMLSPLGARSGRNTPSASRFIFGPSAWMRSLIRPGPGRAVAYIDWSSQEIAVAAALSGDAAMLRAYQSGDPYLAFAIDAGLAPPGATKPSHKAVRDRCKALVLGTLYGMGQAALAGNLNASMAEARSLLRAHRRTYSRFWDWSQAATDHAMLAGWVDTCFGWRLHVTERTKPTSLLNHPMQSHGAEMLRLACAFMVEDGVELVAPVHDAVLIEADASRIGEEVARARQHMQRAARIVLGGVEVRTDADVVAYPDRYMDERGADMWRRVTGILDRLEGGRTEAAAA
jgi:DNA polymerase-1